MTPPADADDDVRILPPDFSLQKKLGGVSFDQIVTPQVLAAAQQAIVDTADQFIGESVAEVTGLEKAMTDFVASKGANRAALDHMVSSSFSIKVKSGLAGYDLISTLAKSLNLRCEALAAPGAEGGVAVGMPIIKWHVDSINQLLNLKIKGMGGPVGEAILAELAKLGVTPAATHAEGDAT
jgi:hypothetical protein